MVQLILVPGGSHLYFATTIELRPLAGLDCPSNVRECKRVLCASSKKCDTGQRSQLFCAKKGIGESGHIHQCNAGIYAFANFV